jgi:hypothetical protein
MRACVLCYADIVVCAMLCGAQAFAASVSLGLARTIYIRFIHSISGREITNIRPYTVNTYGSGQP